MGSIAGSISGVEKQLEEQTALHLEFEQRKVSRTVKRRKEDLCDSDVSNFKLAKKNVFHWSGEGECKSELMMRNITLTEKRKLTWQHCLVSTHYPWLHFLLQLFQWQLNESLKYVHTNLNVRMVNYHDYFPQM